MNNRGAFIALAIGVFLMLSTGAIIMYKQRGLRNNNPGNIKKSSIKWRGMSKVQDDNTFVKFDRMEDGINAMYKNLLAYKTKYGLDTVEKIINRWAPSSENNTTAYVNSVSKSLGINPTDKLTLDRYPTLISAIIKHENGVLLPSDVISRGVNLA